MTGSLWNDEQTLPIQHLRIIDLSVMFPGPFLTRLLAQYGADVIKVEHTPSGDPTRALKETALYDLLNHGKRSFAVDLKKSEAVEMIKTLAGEADVFVENFRDGVMDALGLGYVEISEANPDLIYLSLRGLSGKNSAKAAHDHNFIAQSGVGEWFLEGGHPHYSTQFGDVVGGMLIPAIKLLMHLANPARTGMHLVSYMDEGFRSLYLARAYDKAASEKLPEALRSQFGLNHRLDGEEPHSRYYCCRDGGWISLSAIQEKHWNAFCDVTGHGDWKARHRDRTLTAEVAKVIAEAPASYWESLADTHEMCLFRVLPWEEHLSQSSARSQLSTDPLSWAGFTPRKGIAHAPALGADTYAVATSLGLSPKEISDLLSKGVLFQPESPK